MSLDVILIDGNNLLYQSAFAFNTLTTYDPSKGEKGYTGGIYGFLLKLIELDRRYQCDIVTCWDAGSVIREEIDPEYKKKRKEGKTEKENEFYASLIQQRGVVKLLLSKAGRRQAYAEGYEADDVIGSLCKNTTDTTRIGIYSGDKDLYQLLSSRVLIIRNKGGEYTHTDFFDEYGIDPQGYFHVQTLTGCSTDEVPGIKGVGVKTAVKVLKEAKNKLSDEYYNWERAWGYCVVLKKKVKKPDTFTVRVRDLVADSKEILMNSSLLVSIYHKVVPSIVGGSLTEHGLRDLKVILGELDMKSLMDDANISCIAVRYSS